MAFEQEIARANGYAGLVDHRGAPVRDVGDGASPREGYDGFSIPHVLQFSSNTGSIRGFWRDLWDEALRSSRTDALVMENDPGLMGPLEERMLACVSLPGHVHVPDEKDPAQKQVKDHIERTLDDLVGPEELVFKMKKNLLWGVWFGRQGAKTEWDWTRQGGIKTLTLREWAPLRGDKISHLKDRTPAVDVYAASTEETFPDSDITVSTNGARILVLQGSMDWGWRNRVIIHRHELIDRDFFDAEAAEAALGSGVRSRVFWLDWVSRQWLARTCDFVDRVGLGVNLWYYDAGNPEAKRVAENASKNQSERTNILVPRWGAEKHPALERVEVPVNGAELLLRLRQDIREQQRLYIIGQTMSTGGDHVGGDMGGSHRAKMATDTKSQIRNFDARNLDATMTGSWKSPGLIGMIQYHTFPSTWPSEVNPDGFRASWVTDLEDQESLQKLEAGRVMWEMGVSIKADELRGAAGFSKPTDDDEQVVKQEEPQQQMPGVTPEQDPNASQGGPKIIPHLGPKGGKWMLNTESGQKWHAPETGGMQAAARTESPEAYANPAGGRVARSLREELMELYVQDAQGHEHKGEGPGGGQFTSGGGAATAKKISPGRVSSGISQDLSDGAVGSAVKAWQAVPKEQRSAVLNRLGPEQRKQLLTASMASKGQSSATPPVASPAQAMSPVVVAGLVHDVGRGVPDAITGHVNNGNMPGWESHKPFISEVYDQLRESGKIGDMTLDEFKRHLLEANRQGLVRLSRLDLVQGVLPRGGKSGIERIEDSAIKDKSSEFSTASEFNTINTNSDVARQGMIRHSRDDESEMSREELAQFYAGFDPNQPRDENGRWAGGIEGLNESLKHRYEKLWGAEPEKMKAKERKEAERVYKEDLLTLHHMEQEERKKARESKPAEKPPQAEAQQAAVPTPGIDAAVGHVVDVVRDLGRDNYNVVHMEDVRDHLARQGITGVAAQDEAIVAAAKAGLVEGSTYEGQVGNTERRRAARIDHPAFGKTPGSGGVGYLSLREGAEHHARADETFPGGFVSDQEFR